ncbi:MAG: HAD-IA family hydrolase [Bacteroidales bacterium]|nr:HAD-IA family hydrolase [Bacteroidales bacterium]
MASIRNYLIDKPFKQINLKAVLFDMDGVLYNSMPNHAKAWTDTLAEFGVQFPVEEAYMHEGRTGESTIDIAFRRTFGRSVSKEEVRRIYSIKTERFNQCPAAEVMPGASDLLKKLKYKELQPMLVTGSGQKSLLERLNTHFPDTFERRMMITADDVQFGKPHPEPYLKALELGGFRPDEALVVENAPLGVEAAHSAGIFTICVNTGPLPDSILLDAGADLLFDTMPALNNAWEEIVIQITNYELRIKNYECNPKRQMDS